MHVDIVMAIINTVIDRKYAVNEYFIEWHAKCLSWSQQNRVHVSLEMDSHVLAIGVYFQLDIFREIIVK